MDEAKKNYSTDELNNQLSLQNKKHFQDTVSMLKILKDRFGPEVLDVVAASTAERSWKEGEELARELGSNSIEDIIRSLWVSGIPLGLEYTSEEVEDGIQMKCTRCYIHDMAKELGLTDWAYLLFCVGDPYFMEGFNPDIGFTRTKSLMEGHDHCNHYMYMKKDKK
jgi:hypothetical protein